MRTLRSCFLFCVAALGCLAGKSADAQVPDAHACYTYGGYGLPYSIYGWEYIPYYALHPPVYYSHPIPRTYGYSPFAYPPGVMTPDVEQVQPAEIINPHVPPPEVEPTADRSAARLDHSPPLVILNPYVDQPGADSQLVSGQ